MHAFIANSRHRRDWALRVLHEALLARAPDAVLGVLGLAYKENTHSIKNSPSIALIRHLDAVEAAGLRSGRAGRAAQHPTATGASSALDAAKGADALVIMTPWPEFRNLSCDALAKAMRGKLVLDPYRVLDPAEARAAGLDYRTLGVA